MNDINFPYRNSQLKKLIKSIIMDKKSSKTPVLFEVCSGNLTATFKICHEKIVNNSIALRYLQCAGSLQLKGIGSPDAKFATYYPRSILKKLSLLDENINIKYGGIRTKDGSVSNIQFSDKENEVNHYTVPLRLIDINYKKEVPKFYKSDFIAINKETIKKIIKASKILKTDKIIFTNNKGKNENLDLCAKFENGLNSISIPLNVKKRIQEVAVNILKLKAILSVNKNYKEAYVILSDSVITILFKDEIFIAEYSLPKWSG